MNFFSQVYGQASLVKFLAEEVEANKFRHAYLFTGNPGIGKQTLSFAFAQAILAKVNHLDQEKAIHEMIHKIKKGVDPDFSIIRPDGATIKIKTMREQISRLPIRPYQSALRIIMILETEKMTSQAQNALLKSLEEPLPHNLFILNASQPELLLQTIRSRCQIFDLKPLNAIEMQAFLKTRGYSEDKSIPIALKEALGVPGQALKYLDNQANQVEKSSLFTQLFKILEGDLFEVFPLSENLANQKDQSQAIIETLIHWFHQLYCFYPLQKVSLSIEDPLQRQYYKCLNSHKTFSILETLFDFLDKIQYNINLRLQWEATLITLMKITMNNRPESPE